MKSTIQNKSADYLDLWTCSEFCKLILFHKSLIWGHFEPIFFLLKYLGPILVHFEWAVYMEPKKGLSPICFLLPPCIWGVCMSVMLHNRFSGTVLCYWDILPPVARLGPIHAVMHFSGSLRCSDFNPTPSSLYKTHCSKSFWKN